MNVLTIFGTRPQFIKAAPVIEALEEAGHCQTLVHTGQHYDYEMSKVFFEELGIAEPYVNLEVGSGPHGMQTGRMLIETEKVLKERRPDIVLVYGDTNSTLAGALAACKLRIPLAHVEAGLRSFNREMPEEHNRVLTDHCSDLLFCPTRTAREQLRREGITRDVHLVGDTMYDSVVRYAETAGQRCTILADLGLRPKEYMLATVHRPYNTDVPGHLKDILRAFRDIGQLIVFPVHPRTRQRISELGEELDSDSSNELLKVIAPVGYLEMLALMQNAKVILTDSGGMQKEAYFLEVPCVTLRPETEWVETVEAGWNVIAGHDYARIMEAARTISPPDRIGNEFGDGKAAKRIVDILQTWRLTARSRG